MEIVDTHMADWFIARAPYGGRAVHTGLCLMKGRERWEDRFWERERSLIAAECDIDIIQYICGRESVCEFVCVCVRIFLIFGSR